MVPIFILLLPTAEGAPRTLHGGDGPGQILNSPSHAGMRTISFFWWRTLHQGARNPRLPEKVRPSRGETSKADVTVVTVPGYRFSPFAFECVLFSRLGCQNLRSPRGHFWMRFWANLGFFLDNTSNFSDVLFSHLVSLM